MLHCNVSKSIQHLQTTTKDKTWNVNPDFERFMPECGTLGCALFPWAVLSQLGN